MGKAVVSNVFVIILGMFVIGFLLSMGYLWVSKIRGNIEDIDYTSFKSSFEDKIKANLYMGNEDSYGIAVPGQITKVCFANYDMKNPEISKRIQPEFDENALIKQVLDISDTVCTPDFCSGDNALKVNVFLFRTDGSVDKEFIDKLKPGTGFDLPTDPCIKNERGKLRIKLTGYGKYVEVSPS